MLPRERIENAISYRAVDKLPLRILPSAGGLHEHGKELLDLHKACGHDFGDLSGLQLPQPPPPEHFDADGRYHAIITDAWGTTWEYRIFGIWGHPIDWPLNDLSKLDEYRTPDPPGWQGPAFAAALESIEEQKRTWFTLGGGGSMFEKLHSLRRFEDVLMDIAEDTPEINRIANLIHWYNMQCVAYSTNLRVDGICFGDDYGTQCGPILSPEAWRRFFKPRYAELFEAPLREEKKILFHCCGKIDWLLEDMKELGVDVIWPQLTAFELPELAKRCRDLELAIELHPDRGDLMQRGRPDEIRDYVLRLIETFDTMDGGSWLYIEIDPGFPWENVEALFEIAMELRA